MEESKSIGGLPTSESNKKLKTLIEDFDFKYKLAYWHQGKITVNIEKNRESSLI